MSIFDKFKANPYISTYAGAPIGEFNHVAGTLQQRMLQNTAKKNQIELALADVETSGLDEEFKEKKIAEYQKALQEIAEAPEYATQKVMSLAHRRDMDEDFRLMSKNAAAQKAIEAKMEELDVSDPQRRKYQALIDKYQEADEDGNMGAAAGRKFGNLDLYEEQVIGDLVENRVDGIKAVKSGNAVVQDDGTIRTAKGEYISQQRVVESALGVLSDPKVMKQVTDEQQTYAPDMSVQDYFLSRYVNGAIQKHAVNSTMYDLKGGRKDLGANAKNLTASPVFVMDANAFVQDRVNGIETSQDFFKTAHATRERLNDSSTDYGVINDLIADENMHAQLSAVFDEAIATDEADFNDYEQEALRKLYAAGEFDFTAGQIVGDNTRQAYGTTSFGGGTSSIIEHDPTKTSGLTLKRLRRELQKSGNNLSDEQLQESANKIQGFMNGKLLSTDFTKLLERGVGKTATDAKTMVATKEVFDEVGLESLNEAMVTVVAGFSDSELVGAVQVQNDEMMFEALPENELNDRDLSKLKVTGLSIAGKPGAVTVSIPGNTKETKSDYKTYTLNLNQNNSNVAARIANQFHTAAQKTGSNQAKYMDVAMQFGQQELLNSAQMAVNSDLQNPRQIPLSNSQNLAQYATALQTSGLYLVKNPSTAMYHVQNADGENVIGEEVPNLARAVALTVKAAEQARTQGPARQNKIITPR